MRTFFRTNRNTCCEWLNRIQESTTKLANLCGCPEKALRNGFLWLKHLKNTGNTHGTPFENAVVTVVDSLIQLHCYQVSKVFLTGRERKQVEIFFGSEQQYQKLMEGFYFIYNFSYFQLKNVATVSYLLTVRIKLISTLLKSGVVLVFFWMINLLVFMQLV